ncbi:hypothetical protein BEH94_00845 [Candidatus Altiarchaeales archaeon WOR_SM1_SCG]|nr:hypothetical protein BEH94_00845 [Candidatus Altiarchaeales archaeon WOR_SM1_SCG]
MSPAAIPERNLHWILMKLMKLKFLNYLKILRIIYETRHKKDLKRNSLNRDFHRGIIYHN